MLALSCSTIRVAPHKRCPRPRARHLIVGNVSGAARRRDLVTAFPALTLGSQSTPAAAAAPDASASPRPVDDMAPSVGFLGMGIMGEPMARNLLKSGKFSSVMVWNRTASKCDALKAEGAKVASSAADVIKECDVTFAMLADPAAALDVATGADGVASGFKAAADAGSKLYVDVSTVDAGTAQAVCKAVTEAGGRYLEAPVSGSKKPAIDGTLIFLCGGGDKEYQEVAGALDTMGKAHHLIGTVGAGAKMKLVVNMIMGAQLCALSEGVALADKADLDVGTLITVLGQGALASPLIALKGPLMAQGKFDPAFPLKHQQKDMRLALELGQETGQALAVAKAADDTYREAMEQGLGDKDFCAVHSTVKGKK